VIEAFRVRQLSPDDKVQLQTLYARTRNPYREEDVAEVLAMNRRAIHARETSDRWSALPSRGHHVTDAEHRAFWVAEALANGSPELLGTVGLRIVGDSNTTDADTLELSGLPSLDEWMQAESIGEVRRLRVSPQWRRRGVGTALMRKLISFSAAIGLHSLVLNTTSAQIPALALYAGLGFREIGRSYLDVYELVWMRLTLPVVTHAAEASLPCPFDCA
jgi:ribosomal protein S18 acetylase RimI-like enzyme